MPLGGKGAARLSHAYRASSLAVAMWPLAAHVAYRTFLRAVTLAQSVNVPPRVKWAAAKWAGSGAGDAGGSLFP